MRGKTELRVSIEEFLNDNSEESDQWMSVPCEDYQAKNRVRSMANMMKLKGYPIGIMEYDPETKTFWIEKINPDRVDLMTGNIRALN